jgi:hypothetical protein
MPNSNTREINSALLNTKIELLLSTLKEFSQSGDATTKESLVMEANKIISSYYDKIGGPLYSPEPALPDFPPKTEHYNAAFQNLLTDLLILFSELENVEGLVLTNFNFMSSETNRLQRRLKAVSSKLGDYVLYSDNLTRDAIFFKDSFSDTTKIDIGSTLLNSKQCEINQEEGIITLPIDRIKQKPITVTELPVINPNSNGTIGNNHELGALFHGNIKELTDSNPDSWFEYERVLTPEEDTGASLILDLTINLTDQKIINFIRINPNNFGARTQLLIKDISTSLDGNTYQSIKDDITIDGITSKDEENIFILASSTSKFAGQGLFTFLPRKAKYVHIVLEQTQPYLINTPSGERLRYAIGLRDITIEANQYEATGEVISTKYGSIDEIRKIILTSNQIPSSISDLLSIEHFLSHDDGSTWLQIQPKDFLGSSGKTNDIKEIINFNGPESDATKTPVPVASLRYKALLKRNTSAFSGGDKSTQKILKPIAELLQAPTETATKIPLSYPPVDGTVQVLDPRFGSRDKRNSRFKIHFQDANVSRTLEVQLPLQNIPMDITKVSPNYEVTYTDPIRIYVNGQKWVRGLISGAGITSANINYELDLVNGILRTGGGGSNESKIALGLIEMDFTPERVLIGDAPENRGKLSFPTGNTQDEFELYSVQPIKTFSESLKKGATIHRLSNTYINPTGAQAITFSNATVFADLKTFIDGKVELIDTGDYSVDTTNGIVYSYTITPDNTDTTTSYSYEQWKKVDNQVWKLAPDSTGIINSITVNTESLETFNSEAETISSSKNRFSLKQMNIRQGTISISNGGNALKNEVAYINGSKEFNNAVKTTEVITPLIGTSQVVDYNFTIKISTDTTLPAVFSNTTVFTTLVGGTPTSPGQYQIDRGNNRVRVYIASSITLPGSVQYYHVNPLQNATGLYSINYETGEVYCYTVTGAGATIQYKYSNYRAKYPIARILNQNDFTIDVPNLSISIRDNEIIKRMSLPQAARQDVQTYLINYNGIVEVKMNIQELEPFFSPLLRDYQLKIITKSRLVAS